MQRSRSAAWPVLPLALVLLSACGPESGAQAQEREGQEEVLERLGTVPTAIDTATAAALSHTFRNAASRVLPAVVSITVEQAQMTAQRGQRQQPLSPFDFFFDTPEGQRDMPRPPARGQGSGFIFDRAGYILTNNHVVQNARLIRVTLLDGRVFDAEVVGTDPNTDVAVIRITPPEDQPLPTASFGDSENARVGDWVIALGNPLGLDFTVTSGIISAKGRDLQIIDGQGTQQRGRTAIEAFIQTDAAINPGNSGGPLINLLGEVIGINTAIYSQTGFNAGYGFAIPINLAQKVARDLIEFGYVRRPQLGVLVSAVNEVDAEVYRLPRVAGAEVVQVVPGSPAARAGVEVGDVIVGLDGRTITDDTELITRLAQLQPGEEVELSIYRGGQRRTVEVELGEFERPDAAPQQVATQRSAQDLLGFTAARLTPQLAAQLELETERRQGVVVTDVVPFSTAQLAGVTPGMILLRVNGETIDSVDELEEIAQGLEPGEAVSLLVIPPAPPETPLVINYRTPR